MMIVPHDGCALGTPSEVGVGLESDNPQQDLFINPIHRFIFVKSKYSRSILTGYPDRPALTDSQDILETIYCHRSG